MIRRIALFSCLFLAACSSSSSDTTITDAGSDGTTEGGSDTTPTDTGCTDCIGATLQWGNDGGLVAYQDTAKLSPCRDFSYTRTAAGEDTGAPKSCTTQVAVCGATDVIGLTQIESALANPDVVAAFAAAPVLYGRDTRPVDGSVFAISYQGKVVDVGLDCGGASGCTPIPAGVSALETLLQNLTTQELAKDPCVAVFGPPGGP